MAIYHYIVILTPLLLPHFEIPRCSVGDVMAKTSINGHLFTVAQKADYIFQSRSPQ